MSNTIKIEAKTGAIFNLPYLVAQEEGYFADEGLDIELVTRAPGEIARGPVEFVESASSQSAFGSFNLFEKGDSDLYRACEWGQIRRAYDTERSGKIVAKRASIASQAIIVRPDSPLSVLGDLANVPVGVNFHHGSHYLVLQTLEGFLPRDEIKLVGVSGKERFLALRDGDLDAVAVMEPWITVAQKQGYKILAEAHYFGAEIAHPELDGETFTKITRAVNRAVDTIHEDIRPYLKYFIQQVPDDIETLEPSDFYLGRLRFEHAGEYPQDHFDRTLEWIASWDLVDSEAEFQQLVDNRILVEQ